MKNLRLLFFALFIGCFVPVLSAQTTVFIMGSGAPLQFFDGNGNPLNGGCVKTFAAGTSTPQATYTDSTGSVQNSNPIVLGSNGFPPNGIWLSSLAYKFQVFTAGGVNCATGSQIGPTIDNFTWVTPLSTFNGLVVSGALNQTQPTAATNSANQSSFSWCQQGSYWTGSAAATDKWCAQVVLGTGSNPTSTWTWTHTGSSGAASVSLPAVTAASETVTGTLTPSGGLTQASVASVARDCRQDGTLDPTGATDNAALINTCIANAFANGQKPLLPAGFFKVSGAVINAANARGLEIDGTGDVVGTVGSDPSNGTWLLCNTGTQCMETEGSASFKLKHIGMLLNGTLAGHTIGTPTKIGLITGRDNSSTGLGGSTGGGSGSGNNFCFQEQVHLEDVVIANLGTPSGSINGTNGAGGTRGYVPWYNAGGAENGQALDINLIGGTPFVSSTTDIIGPSGTYYTLVTGCPASLTRMDFINSLFQQDGGTSGTNPNTELNNFSGYDFYNVDFLGGNAAFLLEGSGPNGTLIVTGQQEGANPSTSYFIEATAGLINGTITVSPGANTAYFNPLSNGLGFNDLYMNFGESPLPLSTNTATGTTFNDDHIHFNNTTLNMSNVTIGGSDIYNAGLSTCGTLHTGSNFWLHTGSGGLLGCGGFLVSGGQIQANEASGSTPGYAFNGDPTTGVGDNGGSEITFSIAGTIVAFINSGEILQGSGQVLGWSSNANPTAAGIDTGQSRISAGITGFGTGAAGNTAGEVKAAGYISGGSTFAISGCSVSAHSGGATAGQYTSGTGGTCTVTITMGNSATAPNAWVCFGNDVTTSTDKFLQTSGNQTTATFSFTTASADVINFGCLAY